MLLKGTAQITYPKWPHLLASPSVRLQRPACHRSHVMLDALGVTTEYHSKACLYLYKFPEHTSLMCVLHG